MQDENLKSKNFKNGPFKDEFLKMSELVTISKTPKSTILYYIKEGLLPKPVRLKANVHFYPKTAVKMLEFIKYTQTYLNFSIKELKALVLSDDFSYDECYAGLLNSLDTFMGAGFKDEVKKDEILSEFDISKERLECLIKDGYILERDGILTMKEVEILRILKSCKDSEIGLEAAEIYLEFAKNLSNLEAKIGKRVLKSTTKEKKEELLKLILDITLILKPYIFNNHTFNAYKRDIK